MGYCSGVDRVCFSALFFGILLGHKKRTNIMSIQTDKLQSYEMNE